MADYIDCDSTGEIVGDGTSNDANLAAITAFLKAQGRTLVVAPRNTDRTANIIDLSDPENPKVIPRPASQPAPIGPAWRATQNQARVLIEAGDIIVTRCAEAGIPVPADWKTYRAALRVILRAATGDPTLPLPIPPQKPPGL
jgi:hypothetical protein